MLLAVLRCRAPAGARQLLGVRSGHVRAAAAPSPATPPPPATPPAPAPVRMVASDTRPMSVILSTQGPGCSAPLLLHTSLLSVSTAAEFSLCCCIDKEETVTTIKKDPILECTHKNTEQCH